MKSFLSFYSEQLSLATSEHRRASAGKPWLSAGAALLMAVGVSGCGKPSAPTSDATPTPAPTATPVVATPAATATPTPTPMDVPKYSGTQQNEYIKTAANAFIEARGAKVTPYLEADKAFADAGGVLAKGLTSKEAIAQRRELLAKLRQTNDDYLAFVANQDNAYRDELSKTPLIKADVDGIVADFASKRNSEAIKQLRQKEGERLKTADDMLAFLDKKFGAWSLNNGKLSFKKPADLNAYAELGKKYSGIITETQKLKTEINSTGVTDDPAAAANSSPGAGASPAPVAATPKS